MLGGCAGGQRERAAPARRQVLLAAAGPTTHKLQEELQTVGEQLRASPGMFTLPCLSPSLWCAVQR